MKRESVYQYLGKRPPGATIHYLRKIMGWSQRDLGERCGLNHTSIRRYELNEGFTQDSLEKVAKAFGVEVAVLFCPPEVAEIYRLPKKAQTEVFAILKHIANIHRQNE
jgi:transcriptional regulator with XRE-family HTH domain